jgi:hypothetical protein
MPMKLIFFFLALIYPHTRMQLSKRVSSLAWVESC